MLWQRLTLALLVRFWWIKSINNLLTDVDTDQNGSYLVDCHIDMNAVEPYAKDKVDAMKLWALSEMLVGQKFDFSQSHSNRQYVQQFQA